MCTQEGCEQYHCKTCGKHYYPEESERSGECADCTLARIEAETELRIAVFGNNYEEAAKFFGW